jgi:hypothetical protein
MNVEELSKIFNESAEKNLGYKEATSIVLKNSRKRVWLIGGFIFRILAMQLYGTPAPKSDFDFIIEEPKKTLILPLDWKTKKNHFGSFKLIGPKFDIDFIPLNNVYAIKKKRISPTIENYLSTVPLTIQSLAFELKTNKLLGKIGVKSLLTKTIDINNREIAADFFEIYNKSLEDYLKEKADSLGFKI